MQEEALALLKKAQSFKSSRVEIAEQGFSLAEI